MENSLKTRLHRSREKSIAIVYRLLPQYRVDFYEGLRERLDGEGIKLHLFYGKTKANLKRDEVDLEWGRIVPQTQLNICGKTLLFQHLPKSIYESDLIVMMQENRILSNFTLALGARRRGIRVALWGHGINLLDKPDSFANRWKRKYSSRVDWWFAYTSKVAQLLAAMNYPKERITIVNNAIDTRSLIKARASITEDQKNDLRKALNLGTGPVGIYCGAMYREKRLEFLLKACEMVKRAVPQFTLIVIGAGPDAWLVEQFAAEREWVRYVGPKHGLERVPYFAVSRVLMMPGAVGLGVLDSFALGTPIVTTTFPFHGPEIEYIENGVNGFISDNDISAYAQTVIAAITSSPELVSLQENARESAAKYTMEAMVSNFAEGVLRAIEAPLARQSRW